jgi:hypothetical protein
MNPQSFTRRESSPCWGTRPPGWKTATHIIYWLMLIEARAALEMSFTVPVWIWVDLLFKMWNLVTKIPLWILVNFNDTLIIYVKFWKYKLLKTYGFGIPSKNREVSILCYEVRYVMATIDSSVSGPSVPLSEICYGYHWQFNVRIFCAIKCDKLWLPSTVQFQDILSHLVRDVMVTIDSSVPGNCVSLSERSYGHHWQFIVRIFCAIKCDKLWLPSTVQFQDIPCHLVRYVMGTTDRSVAGNSVPLSQRSYGHHWEFSIRTFCAIKCDMLWLPSTFQCQDVLCHLVRYVMGSIDSSVSGNSVPLSEICYGHHWQFSIRTFCAIKWDMLRVTLTVRCLRYVTRTIDSSVSGYSVPLSEICYGYNWQFSVSIFCAIKWDMLRISLTVQYQDILCQLMRYVMGTIDSSMSRNSVPLSEICYGYNW